MIPAVLASLLLQGAPGATPSFSFFAAQFEPPERAEAQARVFVAERLPPGLELAQARRRLSRAGMPCPSAAPGEAFTCRSAMAVHIGGGLIGEDTWSVRLAPDGAGRLASATLDHRVIGTGPPNPG